MTNSYVPLIVGDSAPEATDPYANWIWYDTSVSKFKKWNNITSQWEVMELNLENATFEGITNIDGIVKVGDEEAHHGDITLAGITKLKVRRGIIIGVQ